MTDHARLSAATEGANLPKWLKDAFYSGSLPKKNIALRMAHDEIERLRDQVQLSDNLLSGLTSVIEGLKAELAERIPDVAQAARDPGEEDVAIALFLARHHGLTNIMPWDDIEHDGRDYWQAIARNLMRTHRVVPLYASQPSPAATVERPEYEYVESQAVAISPGPHASTAPHPGSSAATGDEPDSRLPLQYEDGPDYCTVKDAQGRDFALTMQPELMRAMEGALREDISRLSQPRVTPTEPQPALDRKTIANAVEPIIIRRLFEKTVEGYTLPMSWEVADAILALSRPELGGK